MGDTLAALEAGDLGDVGPVLLSRRDALTAAWEAREEDALAEGRLCIEELRAMRAMVQADVAALAERAATKTALNVDDQNRIGRNAALLAKIGKALRTIPAPRPFRPEREPADDDAKRQRAGGGAGALADRIASSDGAEDGAPRSSLAEGIASRAQARDMVTAENGTG